MQLRARNSSPIKMIENNPSSDWSLSSSNSSTERHTKRTSNRLSAIEPQVNYSFLQIRSPSPSSSNSNSNCSSQSPLDRRKSSMSSANDTETLTLPTRGKRPFVINDDEDDEEEQQASSDGFEYFNKKAPLIEEHSEIDEFIDILEISSPKSTEISDSTTLQGLLTPEEINLSETLIDENDRKLYEMAFNRVEMSQSLQHSLTSKSSQAFFKSSAQKNNRNIMTSSTGNRGKGKDLFSVLKQRVRGPSTPSIRKIYFGTDVAINPWYSAPYPSEYHSESGELWICEFCLQYMKKPCTAQRHLIKCHGRLPPGDEIYRDSGVGISVFEINGRDSKLYCQNLCLLAKMFLDHKTLYYDVDPFLFYVLVEWKTLGTGRYLNSFVGYFSKEKVNPAGFNVSCILTMPHHQRKGYGSFLIDFSYLLSRKENRLGSPEKPLSDLGLFSYVSYWKTRLLGYFSDVLPDDLSLIEAPQIQNLNKICLATGMTENDTLATLEYLRMLRFDIVNVTDNSTNHLNTDDSNRNNSQATLMASIVIDLASVEGYRKKIAARPQLVAHEEFLRWQPYRCSR